MKNIDVNELKKVLRYEPDTGKWFSVKSGKGVGSVRGSYVMVGYKEKLFYAHRLAFLYMTGVPPTGVIDHIDNNRINNSWGNLRDVTYRENSQNKASHKTGKTVGTFFNKKARKWVAQIKIHGKTNHLGIYDTQEDASDAYQKALVELPKDAHIIKNKFILTHEWLIENYSYDTLSGTFKNIKGVSVGFVQKFMTYVTVGIKGKLYQAHRLAWFYVYAVWPTDVVDHINGNRLDNSFTNLRNVTQRENSSNTAKHRAGHLVGTSFKKRDQKWASQIRINGKNRTLGYFNTQLEAHEAYNKALAELNSLPIGA